ncbi:hypothetical protein EV121DRAFT_270066 [Schizophyllum commune]
MAAVGTAIAPADIPKTTENESPDQLADAVAGLAIQDDQRPPEQAQGTQQPDSQRPLRIYTRKQLLYLHASPLVQLPPGMPELKDWFGTENEQSLTKKEEVSSPPRERRFRRDPEDGDTPSRPSFRATVSQPSQMGNFKHQSLRSDRDRDERDREGIRNMSERYDRDRMGLGLNGRNKDRDVAPHLSSASSTRLASTGPIATLTTRRGETGRKKAGDDDWRRGGERGGREDNGGRREDRERNRSRARDSSRPRREQSSTRRERDDRRGKEDYDDPRNHRRPRDDDDPDDPRRWRDDGKRDERIASRRDRDRYRDERGWDERRDRGDRWTVVEEREARTKRGPERGGGRDRRNGDDEKERGEPKSSGRDRDREREKEPAWMDTYIPPATSGTGILGGKGADGELDGIQAWKKGMKEKEAKEKGAAAAQESPAAPPSGGGGGGLDEIQLFRMMMKKEDDKKKADGPSAEASPTIASVAPGRVSEAKSSSSVSASAIAESKSSGQPASSSAVTSPTADNAAPSLSGLASLPPKPEVHLEGVLPATSRLFPRPSQPTSAEASPLESTANSPTSALSAAAGSRLLSLGRGPAQAKAAPAAPGSPANGAQAPQAPAQPNIAVEAIRRDPAIVQLPSKPGSAHGSAYSPFEDPSRTSYGFEDARRAPNSLEQPMRVPANNSPSFNESLSPDGSVPGMRGSRFAKFFDGKTRDGAAKMQSGGESPVGLRQEPSPMNVPGSGPDGRAMDEIFAMLNNSATHNPRAPNPPTVVPPARDIQLQQQAQLALLQQQGIHPSRLESFYDSHFDDRSFVPDGMVPGLRTAPPPREKGPMFADPIDDPHFSVQRPPPHQRGADPAFWNQPAPRQPPPQQLYGQQLGGRVGVGLSAAALQQQQFRGGPSPLTAQAQATLLQQQQRLPPGLANLGGRPPHDPSQFISLQGLQNGGLHANAPLQTNFNGIPGGGNVPFGGPQIRGIPAAQQLQNAHLGGFTPQELELRAAQAHIMSMRNGGAAGLGGLGGLPQHQLSQQAALLNLRAQQQQQQQQQQQHLAHGLPPHLPQHGQPSPEDLMQLLLAGRGGGPDLDSFNRYR